MADSGTTRGMPRRDSASSRRSTPRDSNGDGTERGRGYGAYSTGNVWDSLVAGNTTSGHGIDATITAAAAASKRDSMNSVFREPLPDGADDEQEHRYYFPDVDDERAQQQGQQQQQQQQQQLRRGVTIMASATIHGAGGFQPRMFVAAADTYSRPNTSAAVMVGRVQVDPGLPRGFRS